MLWPWANLSDYKLGTGDESESYAVPHMLDSITKKKMCLISEYSGVLLKCGPMYDIDGLAQDCSISSSVVPRNFSSQWVW